MDEGGGAGTAPRQKELVPASKRHRQKTNMPLELRFSWYAIQNTLLRKKGRYFEKYKSYVNIENKNPSWNSQLISS